MENRKRERRDKQEEIELLISTTHGDVEGRYGSGSSRSAESGGKFSNAGRDLTTEEDKNSPKAGFSGLQSSALHSFPT